MRTMTVRGDSSPRTAELTENAYIIRKGIQPFADTQEDGTVSQGYTWTEVRLDREEYLAVREGRLPPGAAWTADLRRIRLLAQLEETDYIAAKLAEAEGDELTQLRAEYAGIIAQRKAWRVEINSLE